MLLRISVLIMVVLSMLLLAACAVPTLEPTPAERMDQPVGPSDRPYVVEIPALFSFEGEEVGGATTWLTPDQDRRLTVYCTPYGAISLVDVQTTNPDRYIEVWGEQNGVDRKRLASDEMQIGELPAFAADIETNLGATNPGGVRILQEYRVTTNYSDRQQDCTVILSNLAGQPLDAESRKLAQEVANSLTWKTPVPDQVSVVAEASQQLASGPRVLLPAGWSVDRAEESSAAFRSGGSAILTLSWAPAEKNRPVQSREERPDIFEHGVTDLMARYQGYLEGDGREPLDVRYVEACPIAEGQAVYFDADMLGTDLNTGYRLPIKGFHYESDCGEDLTFAGEYQRLGIRALDEAEWVTVADLLASITFE